MSTGARDESVYAEYKVVLDAADASSYGPLGKRLTEVDAADRKQDINAVIKTRKESVSNQEMKSKPQHMLTSILLQNLINSS